MKKIIAAIALTTAIATPAMAASFRQSGASNPSPAFAYDERANGPSYRAPTSKRNTFGAYAAYAYVPQGWEPQGRDTTKVNSPLAAMDPDPNVRHQLQIQSDLFNR